ncbi:unnamed protein product [Kuraishia capsulata CBS 1993]|uniref:Uncharacterized protein n=1 Tax=Kuraishia capsulata CBS 1993 TaxID=1382522 RepID=W6MHA4_9ASCO|nr:uncharacterized protein KUCA_T00001310001 [Kuraishia capsulata CBS 1993]CDK25341.1 unnamed protein product [Kuraishia capsulata CBS 1993]
MASNARFNTEVAAYPQYPIHHHHPQQQHQQMLHQQHVSLQQQQQQQQQHHQGHQQQHQVPHGHGHGQSDYSQDYSSWDLMESSSYDPLSQYILNDAELQTSSDVNLEDILKDDDPLLKFTTGAITPKDEELFEFVKSSPGVSEDEEADSTIVVANEVDVKRATKEADKQVFTKVLGLGIDFKSSMPKKLPVFENATVLGPIAPKLKKSKSTLNAKSLVNNSPVLKNSGFHSTNSTPTFGRNRTLSLSECSSTLSFPPKDSKPKVNIKNSKQFAFIVEQSPPQAIFKHNPNSSNSTSPRSNSNSPTLASKFEKLSTASNSSPTPQIYSFENFSSSPSPGSMDSKKQKMLRSMMMNGSSPTNLQQRFKPKVYKDIREGMVEFQLNVPGKRGH